MEIVLRSFTALKPFANEAFKGSFQMFVASTHVQSLCLMSSPVVGVEVFDFKALSINTPADSGCMFSLLDIKC